jgi:alpha-beta hydrolase superfamily lysophospholipase
MDVSVARHRQSLAAASELAGLAATDTAVQLDLGRQRGRLARALQKAKLDSEALKEYAEARRLFAAHRDAAKDAAAVDRLIAWADRHIASLKEIETGPSASAEQPRQ